MREKDFTATCDPLLAGVNTRSTSPVPSGESLGSGLQASLERLDVRVRTTLRVLSIVAH